MKKFLLAITVLILAATTLKGQVAQRSIGLTMRTGSVVELSFQSATKSLQRFEFDLRLSGIGINNIGLTGIWQTLYPVGNVPGMNWYVGGGAYLGIYNVFESFSIGALGDIGLEFNIQNAPISFSLDWRPAIYYMIGGISRQLFIEYGNFGLGIRYRF